MQKKQWLGAMLGLVLVQALGTWAYAKDVRPSVGGRGAASFQSRMERAVGLTPEQREVVRGLLAQQRQDLQALRDSVDPKYAAVREQTDAKIRALLNAEQQKKFDTFLSKQKQERSARRRKAS